MKNIIKIISVLIIIIILVISYLSVFGLKTKKFNNQIKEKITSLNQKINLELKEVKFLLNPLDLSFNAKTLETKIIIDNNLLELESLRSKISLKSFIKKEFIIDNINISTKAIKINDIIKLARSFDNSTQLFLINKIIKEGIIVGDINLNFDGNGNIKNDYLIKGYVKAGKLGFFKKYNITNLNFFFNINKENYFLEEINGNLNDLKFSSASLKIKEKNNLFSIKGKFLTEEKNDYSIILKETYPIFLKNIDIKNIQLESNNNFSFDISKKFRISKLSLKSEIDLKKIEYKKENPIIKKYFSHFKELINLTNHKIFIDYKKNKLSLKGKGNLLIENKTEKIEYEVKKRNNEYLFNTTLYLTKSELLLDILNYKKKENLNSIVSLNGIYKKNKNIKFNSIVFKENDNKILIKDLTLNNKFKILDLKLLDLLFVNDNKINNQIILNKKGKNYLLEGNSFDASKMLDSIFNTDSDAKPSDFLENFSTNLGIKIKKVHLDNEYSLNNFKGALSLIKSEIDKMEIKSSFKNNKILIASINHINDEKITTLYSDYARPFVKKYNFIKGFEEGSLDFHSVEKNKMTSSNLKIYDFKLKELPVLTKLLTLASLQGIADILSGEGIRFNVFEMKFKNNKQLMTIEEIYALGPAISILMDGYIETGKLISLRGTLVPATTINKAIGSIPLLGNILVGKKAGEGVFGVSFKIKGPPKDLKTSVNPIKTLTPRFITRTLEKIKKE
jgi:hypothetical protein